MYQRLAPHILILVVTVLFYLPLFKPGYVIFSDIAVGAGTERYMEEIIGLWNQRFNTTSLMNLPRVFFVLPSYLLSLLLGGEWLTKSFIILLSFLSAASQFHFLYYFNRSYMREKYPLPLVKFSSICAALFYGLSPWLIVRIQHTYLLCGYALFPLVIHYYLKIFNAKYGSESENRENYIKMATVISAASAAIHYFFFSIIALFIMFFLGLAKKVISGRGDTVKILLSEFKKASLLVLSIFLACAYWLIPYLYATATGRMASQSNINVEETLVMFSRDSSILNVLMNRSYWWSMFPKDFDWSLFTIAWIPILLLMGIGLLTNFLKNDVIKLFSILAVGFLVCATGAYYEPLAVFHEFLVFNVPIVGKVFRDPNKILGPLSFFYSTFLGLGICAASMALRNRFMVRGLFSIVILCCFLIVLPFYNNFILNFYLPVKFPEALSRAYKSLKSNSNKVTFLPQTEDRINGAKNVSDLHWNQNNLAPDVGKSVGDIFVYGTPKDTTFQYEGNLPVINYHYRFIQGLIDKGLSRHVGGILKKHFTEDLIYQKGFTSHGDLEENNEIVLGYQKDLTLQSSDKYLNHYIVGDVEPKVASFNKFLIATVGGLEKLNLYQHINSKEIKAANTVFVSQKENEIDEIKDLPLIYDFRYFYDLVISLTPEKFIVRPFDHINTSMPFIRWSKTSLYNKEWDWFLDSMEMENRDYPVENDGSLLATFSSASINKRSASFKNLKGRAFFDIRDSVAATANFVFSGNQDLQIGISPKPFAEDPVVMGSLSPSLPNGIWRAAKSKLISINQSTPYSVLTSISGRHAESVHLKLHFFSKKGDEIGVSYVSRPEITNNFNKTSFKTIFVTPRNTHSMQIAILSDTTIDKRLFWWIHQFKIEDLSEFKVPNKVVVPLQVTVGEVYKAFARVFTSPKGGRINFNIAERRFSTTTQVSGIARFKWITLGSMVFAKKDNVLTIDNYSGFNAVGNLILIPESEYGKLKKQVYNLVSQAGRMITMEAELTFTDQLNLMSKRNVPDFSNGKGITFLDKPIRSEFEIIRDRNFKLELRGTNLGENHITVHLRKISGPGGASMVRIPIEKVFDENNFPKIFLSKNSNSSIYGIHRSSSLLSLSQIEFRPVKVSQGRYELVIENLKPPRGLTQTSDIEPLYTLITSTEDNGAEAESSCCQCDYPESLANESSVNYGKWSLVSRNTCSWHVLQTKILSVSPQNEYLIRYKYRNNQINESHQKILFLDDKNVELGKFYVPFNRNERDGLWIDKSFITTPPTGTRKMVLLFVFKGRLRKYASLEIKDLSIIDYTAQPMIDFVALREKFMLAPSLAIPSLSDHGFSNKEIKLDMNKKGGVVSFNQPLHPIWDTLVDGHLKRPFLTNGYQHSVNAIDAQVISLKIPIGSLYLLFLFVHILFLFSSAYYALQDSPGQPGKTV